MDESPRPEIRFAPARPDDAGAMRALARRAYRRYVDVIGREPAPMIADYARIASAGETVLAWRGGRGRRAGRGRNRTRRPGRPGEPRGRTAGVASTGGIRVPPSTRATTGDTTGGVER
ncbi:hypothetical protein VV38_03290 [Clavibacter nebraskensis]|uniref:Uncharacterized protein n=1 Tax=Clavibacter nebraskensis TaxID=31963 RepID=A0A399Q2R1_9MICO|nr:hypothetical protein VV38_03290 [Clavibacter nebraskensis]OAH19215.1 hypothetical protein A3Q38_09050 [Clavibacter nebraskensis]RIJ13148.1 hypothetical protein DZF97_07330 [Clavibacter nebraskensis]UKF27832.1 hypothetical protein FGQ65_06105 [Clavibacter nebraskensis]